MSMLSRVTMILVSLTLLSAAYIVKRGDTLWDLSAQFLQNPFAWPDMWEANRHIQDPHWIYPGDSLLIGDAGTPVPQDTTPKFIKDPAPYIPDSLLPSGISTSNESGMSRDDEFRRNLGLLPKKVRSEDMPKSAGDSTRFIYRKVEGPRAFNAYYQVHAPIFVSAEQFREQKEWIRLSSGEKVKPLLHQVGNELLMHLGRMASAHKVGDIVEVFSVGRIDMPLESGKGSETFASLRLAAYAQIIAIGDTLTRLEIRQNFHPLKLDNAKARLQKPYESILVKSYEPVTEANFEKMPRIKFALDPSLIIGAYSYVILDQGSKSGLRPGDGVAIWENSLDDPSLPPRIIGRGILVRTSENESCLLVREIYSQTRRLEIGNKVSVTHRAMGS